MKNELFDEIGKITNKNGTFIFVEVPINSTKFYISKSNNLCCKLYPNDEFLMLIDDPFDEIPEILGTTSPNDLMKDDIILKIVENYENDKDELKNYISNSKSCSLPVESFFTLIHSLNMNLSQKIVILKIN